MFSCRVVQLLEHLHGLRSAQQLDSSTSVTQWSPAFPQLCTAWASGLFASQSLSLRTSSQCSWDQLKSDFTPCTSTVQLWEEQTAKQWKPLTCCRLSCSHSLFGPWNDFLPFKVQVPAFHLPFSSGTKMKACIFVDVFYCRRTLVCLFGCSGICLFVFFVLFCFPSAPWTSGLSLVRNL